MGKSSLRRQTKPQSEKTVPATLSLIALGICVLIAAFGVIRDYYRHRPMPLSNQQTLESPLKKIIQPNAFFTSKIFLNRDKTYVSIPFKNGPTPLTIWLNLETPQGSTPIVRLITHPTLRQLNWPTVIGNGVTLYQKVSHYKTLGEFLQSPPKNAQILADASFKKISPYQKLKLTDLPDNPQSINLAQVDYILTTYHPPGKTDGDITYYETTLDASQATVSDKQELSWLIFAPLATETAPFYIGNVEIDYR